MKMFVFEYLPKFATNPSHQSLLYIVLGYYPVFVAVLPFIPNFRVRKQSTMNNDVLAR